MADPPTKLPTLDVELEAMRVVDATLSALPVEISMRILQWAQARQMGRLKPPDGSGPFGGDFGAAIPFSRRPI